MDFGLKNGLKSRKLWISLLKLLITLCMIGVWKSPAEPNFCGKELFFHKIPPQGKMHKVSQNTVENVEKWKCPDPTYSV